MVHPCFVSILAFNPDPYISEGPLTSDPTPHFRKLEKNLDFSVLHDCGLCGHTVSDMMRATDEDYTCINSPFVVATAASITKPAIWRRGVGSRRPKFCP